MKVYIATSWRNPKYGELCALVRSAGHEVLDWSNTAAALPNFRTLDPRFEAAGREQPWTPELACEMLARAEVIAACEVDLALLREADALLLVTPCGRNAHFEAGFAHALEIPCAVLMAPGVEPELMTAAMKALPSDAALLEWLATEDRRIRLRETTEPSRALHIGERQICVVCNGCYEIANVDGRSHWPSDEEAMAAVLGDGWVGSLFRTFCPTCQAAKAMG